MQLSQPSAPDRALAPCAPSRSCAVWRRTAQAPGASLPLRTSRGRTSSAPRNAAQARSTPAAAPRLASAPITSPMPGHRGARTATGRLRAVAYAPSCRRVPAGPENASLTGLSTAYMTRQVADFTERRPRRLGPAPGFRPAPWPRSLALPADLGDRGGRALLRGSSASLPAWSPSSRATPRRPSGYPGWLLAATDGPWEPVGQRIIEVPDRPARSTSGVTPTHRAPPGCRPAAWRAARQSSRRSAASACHGPASQGLDPGARHRGPFPDLPRAAALRFHGRVRAPGSMSAAMTRVAAQLPP